MSQTTRTEAGSASRLHVALDVSNLERSIAFYRVLFGSEPSKLRPGYAKFEPADPRVNLTLNQGAAGVRRGADGAAHFGVEVRSPEAVAAAGERLRAAGLAVKREEDVECCYAIQDKVWVADPDGNPWEVFVVTDADAPRRTPEGSTCCGPAVAADATGSCCG